MSKKASVKQGAEAHKTGRLDGEDRNIFDMARRDGGSIITTPRPFGEAKETTAGQGLVGNIKADKRTGESRF
ncbi:MAG: hypothetical protein Q6366_007005 [Candidatus Freyarchaeota archaeon]